METTRKNIYRQGFTLIELLIVVVILGLLASLVAPRFFGHEKKAKQKTAKVQISLLETALDSYRLEIGRYPTAEQGLAALYRKPQGVDKWDGPYIKKNIPRDPWGNTYVYHSPGSHSDFSIISFGADGRPGGEGVNQDITNWKDIE